VVEQKQVKFIVVGRRSFTSARLVRLQPVLVQSYKVDSKQPHNTGEVDYFRNSVHLLSTRVEKI
jgi:hypothetical protein